jgi:DNA-binding NarL/FixJ family response regulator
MMNVLICSHDDAFRSECAEALMLEGLAPYEVSGEDGVATYLENLASVDLVIMNAEKPNEEVHRILDYLAQVKPHVRVLLSCDSFSYWDDFFTWMADCCLVTPDNIANLKDAVVQLLAGSPTEHHKPESGNFAVDWS